MASFTRKGFSFDIHHSGMFLKHPLSYVGGKVDTIDNFCIKGNLTMKFLNEAFLKITKTTKCTSIYYCVLGKDLSNGGLRIINGDVDLKIFLHHMSNTNRRVSVFLSQFVDDLSNFIRVDINLIEQFGINIEENVVEENLGDNIQDNIEVNVVEEENGGEGNMENVEESSEEGDDSGHDYSTDDDDDDDDDTASLDHISDVEEVIETRQKRLNKEAKIEARMLNNEETNNANLENDEGIEDDTEKGPRHNPKVHWKVMKPVLLERYESPKQLKQCLTNYALANGYHILMSIVTIRILAVCGKKDEATGKRFCPFRLWATWMKGECSFQIKTLIDEHRCYRNFEACSAVNYRFVADKFANRIRQNPNIKLKEIQEAFMKKFKCSISANQAIRARLHAKYEYEESVKKHYEKLRDYGAEMIKRNPGSTVKLNVSRNPDGKIYFQGFYVCFKGLQDGWKAGCRRIIHLDGCFLKTVCKGELLSAVGRDANNHIFPIAWAVVTVENKENWAWFIDLLKDDLDLGSGNGIALMSDQHKGLIESVKDILPNAEHRQCARHIYANFRKKFNGVLYRNLFWRICKSSHPTLFDENMKQLKEAHIDAYNYLMKREPKTWCRAFFRSGIACEAVENGISECFNSLIVEIRKLQATWNDDICPAIRKRLELAKDEQINWKVVPGGGAQFEIIKGCESYIVDEKKQECTCRMWQLSGIPCPHSVAMLFYIRKAPENYVSSWYKIRTFQSTYSYCINPMSGIRDWPKVDRPHPLPPMERRMPSRPKITRRKDAIENADKGNRASGKPRRTGLVMTCSNCLEDGHNIRSCQNATKVPPPKEFKKAGRARVSEFNEGAGRGIGRGSGSGGRGNGRGSGSGGRGIGRGAGRGTGRGAGHKIPKGIGVTFDPETGETVIGVSYILFYFVC
uniref:uncharacterized protein LOC122601860 n=1 Tax=Erigeron canadensis TaxID=72917 RepID=UPI001CB8AD03|nr:uncharacterized protein LOC122601860 [Erigeron canadensis]